MAIAAPVEFQVQQDEQFALACVSATVQLRFSSLQPSKNWAESAAVAVRTLVQHLGDLLGGRQRRGAAYVVVALLTSGENGLSPTAVATSGYDRVEDGEADAREMVADATQEQHSFEIRTGKAGRKRIMMPLPAFRGSRWLAVQIETGLLLEDSTFPALLSRGLAVFRHGLMASYERCVVGAERREAALMDRLTTPQQAVAKLLLEGMTESEAGVALHRSKHTVHDHVKSIYAAFNVQSRVELVLRWTELLTEPGKTLL
ncbi:MAG: helix-turn-helix transcriptional regulator [Phycisphaerales bacterium]|nr:helix-turn-helix transcriptional regulator [Phycisphaerales bacterium]